MKNQYLSLYYASIRASHAGHLLGAWLSGAFFSSDTRRDRLADAVRHHLGEVSVSTYSSARGALAACLSAAGIGAGDKVLLSSFTCLAVPTALLAVGALPVYLDIDSQTLNTPVETVIRSISSDVKAIIIQHTLGSIAAIEQITAAAKKQGVLVIEDCALAIGSRRGHKPVGTFADAAIFSMELSKTISTGWGGILAVSNVELARAVKRNYATLSELSRRENARRVWQTVLTGICYEPKLFAIGRYLVAMAFRMGIFKSSTPAAEIAGKPAKNFVARLSGAQAVLGVLQWQRLDHVSSICHRNAEKIREAIFNAGLHVLALPAEDDFSVTPRVPFIVFDRQKALRWFALQNVELGTWFDGPLSPLPDPKVFNYDIARYPMAKMISNHIVNLPSHSRLKKDDIKRIKKLLIHYVQVHPEERLFAKQFFQRNLSCAAQ